MNLTELRKLAEAAGRIKCEQEDCPYFGKGISRGCACYNEWETADFLYHDALEPERILALLDVIAAADAMREHGEADDCFSYDRVRARLEEGER